MGGSVKVHNQFARGLSTSWDHHQPHEPSSSLLLGFYERLNPLMPKQRATSSCDRGDFRFDLKSFIKPDCGTTKPNVSSSDERKETLNQVETHQGGTRWNPMQEQIGILELLYRGGMRTPNAQQIEQITTKLGKYGKIEGKNVFYWFQNHKARERQKQKRNSLGLIRHRTRSSSTSFNTISLGTKGEKEVEESAPVPKRYCRAGSPFKNFEQEKILRNWSTEDIEEGVETYKTLELFPLHPEGRGKY